MINNGYEFDDGEVPENMHLLLGNPLYTSFTFKKKWKTIRAPKEYGVLKSKSTTAIYPIKLLMLMIWN